MKTVIVTVWGNSKLQYIKDNGELRSRYGGKIKW